MKSFLLIAIIALMFITSCSDNSVNNNNNNNNNTNLQLIPLAKGNYWVFKNTTVSPFDASVEISYRKQYVEKDTSINSVIWWKMGDTSSQGKFDYFRNSTDGVYILDSNKVAQLAYKYPVKKGDKFDVSGMTMYVTTIDSTININNVKYTDVISYKASIVTFFGNVETNGMFKPGIGFLKIETSMLNQVINIMELTEYKIN